MYYINVMPNRLLAKITEFNLTFAMCLYGLLSIILTKTRLNSQEFGYFRLESVGHHI